MDEEVEQPYYARTGKAHPSLTGKLEVYQLYRAQFPPTATARDRDLTAGGPLSTDIGYRRGAPAAAPRRRTLPLRPSPSPAAGDGVWDRARVADVSGLRGCARGVVPAAAASAAVLGRRIWCGL